jgi:hypothetical protein
VNPRAAAASRWRSTTALGRATASQRTRRSSPVFLEASRRSRASDSWVSTQGSNPRLAGPAPPPLRTAVGGRLAMRDLETRSATWIPQAGLLSRLSPALDSHDAVFRVRGDGVSLRREHRPLRPSARLPNAAPPPGARGGHGLLPWPAVAGERGALHRDEEVRRANSRGSDRCAVLACGAHVHAVPRRPLRRADDGGHGASVDGTRGGQGDGLLRVR